MFGEFVPNVKNVTVAGAISAKTGVRLIGAHLTGDGTNAASVTIYDNATAASGTVLGTLRCPSTGSDDLKLTDGLSIKAQNGIYAGATSIGNLTVYYAE